jgi:hypothetical protein
MLYETLKWPQIAPFCISSKKNPRPPPPLKNYGERCNHNGKKKKDKGTNNDLQNLQIKLKIEKHEPN